MGWATEAPSAYVRPLQCIAVRCRKKNGQWAVGVLISTLSAREVLALTGQSVVLAADPAAVLLAYVAFYDQRGGGIETSFKGDKQGLGLTRRSKKRFEAQQMAMLLGTLAHNVVVWVRQWLSSPAVPLRKSGMLRMVRAIFHIGGFLVLNALGQIILNQAVPLAFPLVATLRELLAPAHVAVSLGQT